VREDGIKEVAIKKQDVFLANKRRAICIVNTHFALGYIKGETDEL